MTVLKATVPFDADNITLINAVLLSDKTERELRREIDDCYMQIDSYLDLEDKTGLNYQSSISAYWTRINAVEKELYRREEQAICDQYIVTPEEIERELQGYLDWLEKHPPIWLRFQMFKHFWKSLFTFQPLT